MSEIDPQEFGRLQAQVETLIQVVEKLDARVEQMHQQLSEARGGWRMLMLIGGASATAGGALSWLVNHLFKGAS